MDAEIGQWSIRRRRINEIVAREQANSVRVGYTEAHDDALTIEQWALILNARAGKLAQSLLEKNELPHELSVQKEAVELAALCHSFLESVDRRLSGIGGKG